MVTEALALAPKKSLYDWTKVAEPIGELYKLNASIKEIEVEFRNEWNKYFD